MGPWPDGPLKLNCIASSYGDGCLTGRRGDMARHVNRRVVADETEAAIFWNRPTSDDWNWILKLEVGVVAWGVDTVDDNALNNAVS